MKGASICTTDFHNFSKSRRSSNNDRPGPNDISSVYPLLKPLNGAAPDYKQESFGTAAPSAHPFDNALKNIRRAQFDCMATKVVKLSALEKYFTKKDADSAVALLNQKCRYEVDDKYCCDPNHTRLGPGSHALDFLLFIPLYPGLDAIRPPRGQTRTSERAFILDVTKPNRYLPHKYGLFGFDLENSCLHIGSRGSDDVWLAMVSEEILAAPNPAFPAGKIFERPTPLSRRRAKIVYAFLLHALTEARIPGYSCDMDEIYAMDIDSEQSLEDAMSALWYPYR